MKKNIYRKGSGLIGSILIATVIASFVTYSFGSFQESFYDHYNITSSNYTNYTSWSKQDMIREEISSEQGTNANATLEQDTGGLGYIAFTTFQTIKNFFTGDTISTSYSLIQSIGGELSIPTIYVGMIISILSLGLILGLIAFFTGRDA